MATAETAPTQFILAKNNVKFAYRRFGKSNGVPLIHNIHFRGSIDFWDPFLVNDLAQRREVILFDNAGVGQSAGEVPVTFAGWAENMLAFVDALGLKKVDLIGFSMGGLAVIEAALAAPTIVRKLIIAGSRASVPEKGPVSGIIWPQEEAPQEYVTRLAAAVTVEEGRDELKYSCFPHTDKAKAAFDAYWKRLESRTVEPARLELLPMEPNGGRQVAAIIDASTPQPNASFDRLGELKMPVLVMNGDSDVLIPTSRSWELQKKIENSQLIIYPQSGHGFLWQYPTAVARDINNFLDSTDFE